MDFHFSVLLQREGVAFSLGGLQILMSSSFLRSSSRMVNFHCKEGYCAKNGGKFCQMSIGGVRFSLATLHSNSLTHRTTSRALGFASNAGLKIGPVTAEIHVFFFIRKCKFGMRFRVS